MSALASALGSLLVKFTADASGFSQGCQQAQASVSGVSDAVNQAAGPMGKLQGQIDSLGATAAGTAGKLVGALGLAGGVAAIGKTAFDSAMMFEQAEARIARSTGATGEHLASLKASFENIYKGSAASSDAIVSAMDIISQRTNATGPALENLTMKMIALAKVSGEDVGAVGPLVTRVFGDWSIATDRQAGAMDFLRAASQQTGTSVSKLAEQVVYAGAPLRMLGYSFEQATALIGKFEKEGVNTELVLGGMKAALQKFAKEGVADPAAEWQKFVDGVQKGTVTMADLIEEVGAKRGPDLYRAIVEGRFQIQGMTADLAKAARDGSSNVSTLTGEFTKLKHYIQTDLGGGMLDFINQTKEEIATVQRLATWFQALVQLNKDLIAHPFSTKTLTDMSALNPTPGAPSAPGVQSWMLTSKTGIKPADTLTSGLDDASKAVDDFAQRWAKAMSSLGIETNKFRDMEAALALVAQQLQKHGVEVPKVANVYWILMEAVKTHVLTMDQAREAMKKWGDEWDKNHPKAQQVALDMSVNKENLESFTKAMEAADAKNLGRVFDMIAKSTFDAAFALDSLPEKVNHMAEMTIAGVAAIDDAYKTLGIKSSASLQEAAEKAQSAYYDIEHSGVATAVDIQRAWVAMVAAQIDAGEKLDSGTITLYERLKTSTASATKQMQSSWKTMMQQVSTAINDLSKSLTDVIFGTKAIGEAFTDLGKTIVRIILEQIIANGIAKLMNALSGVLSSLGGIGKALGGIFGGSGGGGVLGTTVGAASTVGGAASSAGGAGGSAAAGSAMSTVLGIAGLGVSIASGIVSGIQGARTNDLLAEIEASTRYTWLAVGGSGTAIAQMAQNLWAWAQNSDKLFWGVWEPLLTGISANTDSMVALLSQIAGAKGGTGGGGGMSITVNGPLVQVDGNGQSADAIAAAVMRAIPTQIKRYTNSFAPVY